MQRFALSCVLSLTLLSACVPTPPKESAQDTKGTVALTPEMEAYKQTLIALIQTPPFERQNAYFEAVGNPIDPKRFWRMNSLLHANPESVAKHLYGPIPSMTQTSCDVAPSAFTWKLVEGECLFGKAHGLGRAISENGENTFIGDFEGGFFKEGMYIATREKANYVAIGEYKNQMRHGFGGVYYHGMARIGTWKENKPHGWMGIARDGFGLERLVEHNETPHGKGIHIYNRANRGGCDGEEIRIGTFEGDNLNGIGGWSETCSQLYVGEFKNNQKQGGVTLFFRGNVESLAP